MKNSYPEDALQRATATYLDLNKVLWCHVANERKINRNSGANLKKKGVKKGVPDCLIFSRYGGHAGMAMELKIKPNKTTPEQKEWLSNLKKTGWYVAICYNLDDVIKHFQNYVKGGTPV